jgi:[acyl-carrier-protein] S-malonyltransferase
MEPAVEEFRAFLSGFETGTLRIEWVANVTGDVVREASAVVDLLSRQLSSPVLWTRSMRRFAERNPSPVYEAGPGNVLAGLMKRIVDGVDVISLSACDTLPAAP